MPPRHAALLAAALCIGLLPPHPARADLVTPGSVSPQPTGWITDQYKGLGLVFFTGRGPGAPSNYAATYNDGVNGWTPLMTGWMGPAGTLTAGFAMPGTGAPATTDWLGVQVSSPRTPYELRLDAFGSSGSRLGSVDLVVDQGTTTWLRVRAPGIYSFALDSFWLPSPYPVFNSPTYYVTAVEFSPLATAPEPNVLALAGLGGLGLIARARLRRRP